MIWLICTRTHQLCKYSYLEVYGCSTEPRLLRCLIFSTLDWSSTEKHACRCIHSVCREVDQTPARFDFLLFACDTHHRFEEFLIDRSLMINKQQWSWCMADFPAVCRSFTHDHCVLGYTEDHFLAWEATLCLNLPLSSKRNPLIQQ